MTAAHYSRTTATVSETALSWALFGARSNVESEQTFLRPRPASSSSLPLCIIQSKMQPFVDGHTSGRLPQGRSGWLLTVTIRMAAVNLPVCRHDVLCDSGPGRHACGRCTPAMQGHAMRCAFCSVVYQPAEFVRMLSRDRMPWLQDWTVVRRCRRQPNRHRQGHDVTHPTRQLLHGHQIVALGLLHLEGGGNACVWWW